MNKIACILALLALTATVACTSPTGPVYEGPSCTVEMAQSMAPDVRCLAHPLGPGFGIE